MGWLIFIAGVGVAAIAGYALAEYIGRLGRWLLALAALLAVPALLSAGWSNQIRGYPLDIALALAAGSAAGVIAYAVRHYVRAEPQQYLS